RMDALSEGARRLATQMFHYLVTPSGGKFAYLPGDLAYLLGETTGRATDLAKISGLLRTLADSKARVLRRAGERFELFHDILARPILDWRAEYLQNAPFAYLVDLFTGDNHALFGAGQIFGRLPSTVSRSPLEQRMVSRNHLLVLSTGQVLDLRSRFGTTVNACTLLFGDTDRWLHSGDAIGLANVAALRFWTVEDLDNPPDDAPATAIDVANSWAILIDGRTRGVTAIMGQRQYLVIGRPDETIATSEEQTGSFAALHRDERGLVYITSLTENPPLEVVERSDAFRDRNWALQRNGEFLVRLRDFSNPQKLSDLEGAERGLFKLGDRRFEIIPNLLFHM
ncbi:MAG: FHA domain-containing protein, partial [Geminicoccaceae bacterium]